MAGSTRKALLKPFQLLGLSAIFGVVVVLIFLLTTRNLVNGLIAGGVVFIISVVVLAMLVLSYKPNADAPVYLDRFQAESDEPGAKESALKVDVDAALRGESGDAESAADPEPAGEPSADIDDDSSGERPSNA